MASENILELILNGFDRPFARETMLKAIQAADISPNDPILMILLATRLSDADLLQVPQKIDAIAEKHIDAVQAFTASLAEAAKATMGAYETIESTTKRVEELATTALKSCDLLARERNKLSLKNNFLWCLVGLCSGICVAKLWL